MIRILEDHFAGIGAVAGALSALVLQRNELLHSANVIPLFSAAINVGAIGAGFLATCQSVLITGTDNRVLNAMRKNEHFKRLLAFIANSIKCSFLLAIVSAIFMVCDFQKADSIHSVLLTVWLLIACMTASSCYRSIGILLNLLETPPSAPAPDRDDDMDPTLLPSE
jgi:cobalamin synthase